jgi:hypothetical protein
MARGTWPKTGPFVTARGAAATGSWPTRRFASGTLGRMPTSGKTPGSDKVGINRSTSASANSTGVRADLTNTRDARWCGLRKDVWLGLATGEPAARCGPASLPGVGAGSSTFDSFAFFVSNYKPSPFPAVSPVTIVSSAPVIPASRYGLSSTHLIRSKRTGTDRDIVLAPRAQILILNRCKIRRTSLPGPPNFPGPCRVFSIRDGVRRFREKTPTVPFVHAEWSGLSFCRTKRLINRSSIAYQV